MDEEQKLIEAYNHTKQNLALLKEAIASLVLRKNRCEKLFEDAKADLLKYMDETGQIAFESGIAEVSYTHSEQVDIADVNAVPDEYVREKISREPDKLKIKADAADLQGANWFSIKKVRNLQIKLK